MRSRQSRALFLLFGLTAYLTAPGGFAEDKPAKKPSAPEISSRADIVDKPNGFVDLSLLVAHDYPCTWPAANFQPFRMEAYLRVGPLSPYNGEVLAIDENTGTQFDAPSHSVAPPDSKWETAGPLGLMTGDKIPAWQLCGEACVIDCRSLVNVPSKGMSGLVTPSHIRAWEEKHRPLQAGDVVLFASGYSDKYYQLMPAGRRFLAEPLEGASSAWPDPNPDCMEYLANRKVMTAGTDSPTMGPLPVPLPAETHLAGLKHGMIWTEGATGLTSLPPTGAFYCMLGVTHGGGAGAAGRAFAIAEQPLASRLIQSARKKQAVDLSLTLDENLPISWPGVGVGNHRHPYWRKTQLTLEETKGNGYAQTHFMDSHTGTHLVPPSYALPAAGSKPVQYSAQVQSWLTEYEAKHGARQTSDLTTERVPLAQTCGPARPIDVSHLIGTTDKKSWPASPEITVTEIQKYEMKSGDLKPGDVVIFHCGWSDRTCVAGPKGAACMADPLNGKSEGWPALGSEAVLYLAKRGIKCVGTDSPSLGGVDPKQALWTYWTLGGKQMAGVEFLTNVAKLPPSAYFLFAAVKIEGCHGGPGRAIALY